MSEKVGMCNQCGFEWVGKEPPMHQCRPLGYLPYEEFRVLCVKIDKLEQAVEGRSKMKAKESKNGYHYNGGLVVCNGCNQPFYCSEHFSNHLLENGVCPILYGIVPPFRPISNCLRDKPAPDLREIQLRTHNVIRDLQVALDKLKEEAKILAGRDYSQGVPESDERDCTCPTAFDWLSLDNHYVFGKNGMPELIKKNFRNIYHCPVHGPEVIEEEWDDDKEK